MTTNEKLLWGALAGIAVLVPVVLAAGTGSPWYLLLIVVLLGSVGALRFFLTAQREGSPVTAAPTPEPREPEPWSQELLTEIELSTARLDYPMMFSARVIWQPIRQLVGEPPYVDLAATARHAVVERAASFVAERAPSDLAFARSALAVQLGSVQPDSTGRIRFQADDVGLDFHADDADRLRAEADRRKNGVAWQQEREHERSVMDYLHDEVLTSSGRALVWWLAQHPDDIQGAVDRVGQLARLSAIAQGRDDPGATGPQLVPPPGARSTEHRDLAATRDLLLHLYPNSQDQRDFFARELARVADECGQDGYGLRVRQAYGLTPRSPETAPYSDDRGPPYPEDEPPYPQNTGSTTAKADRVVP